MVLIDMKQSLSSTWDAELWARQSFNTAMPSLERNMSIARDV